MKHEANPADYIPAARSKAGVDGDPYLFARYLELHAGRSILWSARAHILGTNPFRTTRLLRFLDGKVDEIEREIEEVKR